MVTLDGVMQAPGRPDEDMSGGFEFGGWSAPFGDAESNAIMRRLMAPADLLLGRTTFEIWEGFWPYHTDVWPTINDVKKYVYTNSRHQSNWQHTEFIHTVEDIQNLKNSNGAALQVWGSSKLIQLLLTNDLIDELWLIIHPITLGQGKKLFVDGAMPANFQLIESAVTPSGLIMANFERAGEVKTGTAGS